MTSLINYFDNSSINLFAEVPINTMAYIADVSN